MRAAAASVLVAVVVFLAAGEFLARALRIVDRLNGFPRHLFVATDDPDLPYVMRPGFDGLVRGVRVTVNEFGMRNAPTARARRPGVRRVLALGDSATFGEGLPLEGSFPAQLEAKLVRRTHTPWEILNAGVEGYNTEGELAWLRRFGLAFAPDVIVVGFNLNDFDYEPVMGPMGVLTTDRSQRVSSHSLANVSEFYLLLRWLAKTHGSTWVDMTSPPPPPAPGAPRFNDFDRYISAIRKHWWRNPDDDRWPTLVASLRGLADAARDAHARLLIAILPDGDQIGVPDPDLTPQTVMHRLCTEIGLDCIDLYPAFVAAGTPDLFLGIMHPNRAGYAIVADVLADRILESPAARPASETP